MGDDHSKLNTLNELKNLAPVHLTQTGLRKTLEGKSVYKGKSEWKEIPRNLWEIAVLRHLLLALRSATPR